MINNGVVHNGLNPFQGVIETFFFCMAVGLTQHTKYAQGKTSFGDIED